MAHSANNRQHAAQTTSVYGFQLVGFLLKLVFMLLAALVVSIVVEWIGMALWWPSEGVEHSQRMIDTEMQYLDQVYESQSVLSNFIDALMMWMIHSVNHIVSWSQLESIATASIDIARIGAISAINVIHVFGLRLMVLILSIPTFLIFGLAGLVRGMVNRELRRWGAGRESSGMFHLYKSIMPASFLGVWFLYLSMPISVNPFLLIGPSALFFAFVVSGAIYRFKKYV